MVSKIAAMITTNLPAKYVKNAFLSNLSNYLSTLMKMNCKDIIVEVQTDLLMMRNGSFSPMMNTTFYHNCDTINQQSKHDYAIKIANFLSNEMKIEDDRILVLFVDTRECTQQPIQ